ncbi:MAG: 2-oxoglutarate oxidoreductase [Clostridiales bacterium]|nr:2-oxoglutarate oxidoreductase [Clostridiales bacterium]
MNFKKPKSLSNVANTYCPGCTHGIITRLIAEVVDELDIEGDTICVASIGCSVFIYDCYNFDTIQGAHGRAPAVATGVKRCLPENIVFTYQGDGDLAAIGIAEIVHSANRGENITVIFVNNGTFGMTGGQAAPTSLLGQVTQTTPQGKSGNFGHPIDICKMLATLEGPGYIERTSVDSVSNILKTKKSIKKAFECQINKKGFSIIEVISTCPTNWKLTPVDSLRYIREKTMIKYPLKIFCDRTEQ